MTAVEAPIRTLNEANIDQIITKYCADVEVIGDSVVNARGRRLLEILKRDAVKVGPYPHVTLFEAANRIMSDLVILHGVKWLLDHHVFPFDSYTVELGNEDKNGFDIHASENGLTLVGEAFNVAQSFFPTKKYKALQKLRRETSTADFKIVMFNHDAIQPIYAPELRDKEYFVVADIGTGVARIIPSRNAMGEAHYVPNALA